MYSLLTVLHTKQVWLAILAATVGMIIVMIRPVEHQSSTDLDPGIYRTTAQIAAARDFNPALDRLIEVGFYTPRISDTTANSDAANTVGASANIELDITPVLRAMTIVNDRRVAYFHVAGVSQSVQENELIEDWRVARIESSSVLLTRGDETLRLYKYERLPDSEPEDSRL